MKVLLLVLFTAVIAQAKEHAPSYPRGTHAVCFEVCSTFDCKDAEVIRAVAVNGMVKHLSIPEGKFVVDEVICE